MKFGFVVPWADAAEIGELAAVAELHGWDGLFVWEPVWGVDAWVALAVAACRTKRIRLGTMLTPLPRRKPWELAGQVATVDRLSNGPSDRQRRAGSARQRRTRRSASRPTRWFAASCSTRA